MSGEAELCFVFVQCLIQCHGLSKNQNTFSQHFYFLAHMYFESNLIHMFLIYLHASHQNVVLYELFDV